MPNSNGFDNKNNDFDLNNNNNLTGKLFSKMIIAAANELDKNRDYIDSLNVFPVPDGDTGTNMSLTILAAAQEIKNLNSDNISYVAKKAAEGALKGARGNSGVILSQLFRGFSKGLENLVSASNQDLAFACEKASQMAYKAVMKPKEGTILTLSREIAESFNQEILNYERLEDAMMATIVYSKKILEKTKDMLPQLKQADVVDSGARGLLFILEGALKALDNKINFDFDLDFYKQENNIKKNSPAQSNFDTSEIDFCYEVLLDINNISENNLDDFKAFLGNIGDSLVITNGDEFIRIHVHTNEPGKIINKAFEFCDLFNARFENLKSQHEQIIKNKNLGPKKNIGFIAVCMGSGFIELFNSLGVDEIIDGGKLMNPSTQDIINAIKKINADKIIILPNDKNIIMAARQAADLCDDKKIIVLETKTIPQGLAALLNYIPDDSNNNFDDEEKELDKSKLEEIENNIISQMQEAISLVKTGQITYAASDTEIDNIKITQGDFLGTIEGDVVLCEKNLETAVISLIDLLIKNNNGAEILTLYYGEDITQDQTNNILDYVNKTYPDLETEIHNGNQPLYFYIISLE